MPKGKHTWIHRLFTTNFASTVNVRDIPKEKLLFETYRAAGGKEKTEEDAKKEYDNTGGKIGRFGEIAIETNISEDFVDGEEYDRRAGEGTFSGVVRKLREKFEDKGFFAARMQENLAEQEQRGEQKQYNKQEPYFTQGQCVVQ